MKQFYMLFAALTFSFSALAQLPDGSIAPDFTATDIEGNEWNLYQLLDEGKTVILDFSATWCGPCWSYAQSGILEEMYAEYGPEGSNDVMIFYLESDDTTTDADLNGTGAATTGDWVSITNFPIIDNAGNIFDDYSNTYYPTIYTVCPDKVLVQSGQGTFNQHVAAAFAPCDNYVNGVAAPVMTYTGETSSCGGAEWSATTEIVNVGEETITEMTIEITLGGASQTPVNWTGSLVAGATEVIDLGMYTDVGTLEVDVAEVNGEDWDLIQSVDIVGSEEATTSIQVRIMTDNWPQETGWSIINSNGAVVESSDVGAYTLGDNLYTTNVTLDLNECYTFTMIDTYGDGLNASYWGDYADGYAQIVKVDGAAELGYVLDYQGSSGVWFEVLEIGMEVTEESDPFVNSVNEVNELTTSVTVYPNPFSGNTNLEFTTPEAGDASVVVYNLVGEKVIDMNLGSVAAGTQNIQLDFSTMNTGIYLLSVTAAGETSTHRVTKTQ